MRPIHTLFVALIAFMVLAGCGTKTPLTLPSPEHSSAATSATCPQIRNPCLPSTAAPILMADGSSQVAESRL